MQVYTLTYPDSRKDKIAKPNQDIYLFEENIFMVGDGVTILHVEPYPETSVNAVKEATIAIAQSLSSDQKGISSLYNAFEKANKAVSKVKNIKKHYGGLTTAFGFVKENILYFGQLNDAGVMVFDKHGNREIDFITNQTDYINHLNEKRQKGDFEPGSPQEHKYVREKIVNKKYNFSVLNGDPKAKEYFHVGSTNLSPGQTVFFYTDGFIPFVYDQEFVDIVIKNPQKKIKEYIKDKEQKAEKYKKEKTIIIIKV